MSLYCHRVCQNPQKQTYGKIPIPATFLVLSIILTNINPAAAGISVQWLLVPATVDFILRCHSISICGAGWAG